MFKIIDEAIEQITACESIQLDSIKLVNMSTKNMKKIRIHIVWQEDPTEQSHARAYNMSLLG